MKTREFKFILLIALLMLPLGLISIESKEFDDFFDAQDERELEKIQKREELIKKLSDKYILTFFYVGNEVSSKDAAKYLQNLAIKYNWLTYAISLDGVFIDGFENNKINNGVYDEFQNRSNAPYRNFKGPSLFLFNLQNNDVCWIVSGSSEFEVLEDLIYAKHHYFGL